MTGHHRTGWTSAIRRCLPPPIYLFLAGLLVCLLEVIWFSVWYFSGHVDALNTFIGIRDGTIAFLLMAYGAFRVMAFHPLVLREYSSWLERTPWHPRLPLPLGPVHLAWPDLIVAGGLALLLEDHRELMMNVPMKSRISGIQGLLLFVQMNAMTMAVAVWFTRPRGLAYAAAFLIALGARLSLWSPLAGLIVLAAGIFAAHAGLRQSWSSFPWVETSDWLGRLKTGWQSMQMQSGQGFANDPSPDRVPPAQLGWPFGACSPYIAPRLISTPEKVLLAALLGFWIHVLLAGVPPENVSEISGMVLLFGMPIVLFSRLVVLGSNHASPINFVGRIFTMRWIVPRYDAAIIAPFCVISIGGIAALLGNLWLKVPTTILTPSVLTLTMWAAFLIGPSRVNWKLTAPARLHAGRLNSNQFEELS